MDREEIRNWSIFGGLSLLFTIGMAVLALGPGLDWALGRAMERLPLDTEAKLGATLLDKLFSEQASEDPRLKKVLERCAKRLPEAGEERHYRVLVLEVPELNAFALPGGSIVLNRGLLDKLKDESELFAVLGHEAGHVRQRHFLKRVARAAGIGAGFVLLLGDTSGLLALLADSSQELLLKGYGRKEESDADDAGLATLKRLELDPQGILRLMQRLQDAGGEGATLPEFLSTHPSTQKRMERLKEALKDLPKGAKKSILSAEEWAVLKRKPKASRD